jgi:hypothetical protein
MQGSFKNYEVPECHLYGAKNGFHFFPSFASLNRAVTVVPKKNPSKKKKYLQDFYIIQQTSVYSGSFI